MTCRIEGCDRPVWSTKHGLCNTHYCRLKQYGDPEAGGSYKGHVKKFFEETVLNHEDQKECLIWPYYRNPKGWAKYNGELIGRVICKRLHGPPPTSDSDAAHSCGNGHLGCCNRHHVRWTTHAENMSEITTHRKGIICERV